MPQSPTSDLSARVEAAIERGDLDGARRLLDEAEQRLGAQPELLELRQRLGVVESTLAGGGRIDAAIRGAREEISRANYPAALATLQEALKLAPQDAALREMLDLTSKAAMRHDSAVERNRAVAQTGERLAAMIERGDLETASTELREASLRFGKHPTLQALQDRLEGLWKEAELERTVAGVDQGRAFLDGKKWQEAVLQADRVLRADPHNQEAQAVKQKARAEIEREEARRQAELEIDQARQDVERMMGARELQQAGRALRSAEERLGRHEAFTELGRRLDQSKAELQAEKRLEWTQRRLKEADDLVRQAGRLLLQGQHDDAIRRLHQARELHPEHGEIEDLLKAAHTGRERASSQRHRAEALQAAKSQVRHLLDALRLGDAAMKLQTARSRFGDDAELLELQTRLERLREVEEAGALPEPSSEAAALEHQQALAAAYSWKQTLLYALRDRGAQAFLGCWLAAVALDLLGVVPVVGLLFQVLRWCLPVALLGWLLVIVRDTLRGRNVLPAWEELLDVKPRSSDLLLVLAIVLTALMPLLVFVVTRGWHRLFAGASGWWLAAGLGWCAAAASVFAAAAGGGFGVPQAWRFDRHLRAFLAGEPDLLVAVNAVFAAASLVLIVRATFLPFVPWLGAPLAAAVEVYALLSLPHLIGVIARRHRIELTRLYPS